MALRALLRELREALRGLMRAPRFTVVVSGTVMIGVGATLPLYSAAYDLLLRTPSGVQSSSRLVELYTSRFTGATYGPSSYPDFVDLGTSWRAVCGLAAYEERRYGRIQVGSTAQAVQYTQVSDGFFSVLGLEPHAGSMSLFEAGVGRRGVVISAELSATAGARVGTQLMVDGAEHVVVGVAPLGFNGLHIGTRPQLWIPLHPDNDGARGRRTLKVIGRLCHGVSLRVAQEEVGTLAMTIASAHPNTNRGSQHDPTEVRRFTVSLYSQVEAAANPQAALVGFTLVAATGVALLCAMVNACSLMLARALAREKEFAVRVALGAKRASLGRLVLFESMLLSIIGGGGGLVLSFWVARTLSGLLSPEEYALVSPRPTREMAAGVLAVACVVGALVGLVPAVSATRGSLLRGLRLDRGVGGSDGARLRLLVVSGQVSLSMTFLIGAALGLTSFSHFAGGPVSRSETALITIERTGSAGEPDYHAAVLDRLRRMDDVKAVGSTVSPPLSRSAQRRFWIAPDTRGVSETVEAAINFVSVGYFRALEVPVLAGRAFEFRDEIPSESNVVVNEAFANNFLGSQAVGRKLEDPQGTTLLVVGVVRNEMHRALQGPPEPTVYYPSTRANARRVHVLVRLSHFAEYARELGSVPGGKIVEVASLESRVATVLLHERIAALLIGASSLSVLLLTVFGVYAVAGDEIRRRTQEVALRLALGATNLHLFVHFSKTALLAILAGACLGLAFLFWLLGLVRWATFFPPVEATVVVAATFIFVSVAVVAALVPVRRVTQIDPWAALRGD
jgi:predicted permease